MIEVGSLCVKTCGRDATELCLVVDIIDNNYVMIDGNTRRKKVNKNHIEPLGKVLKIKKGADTKEILSAMKSEKIEIKKMKKNL